LDALDRGTKERDQPFSDLPEDLPQAPAGSTVRQTPAALHHDGDENLKDYIAAEEQETNTDESSNRQPGTVYTPSRHQFEPIPATG
jgi:hypothetical protein